MAKAGFKSVDQYIAVQPADLQKVLKRVRSTLRKALPTCKEVISFQISAYQLDGRAVITFAGWKRHYSLYPATTVVGITSRAADAKVALHAA